MKKYLFTLTLFTAFAVGSQTSIRAAEKKAPAEKTEKAVAAPEAKEAAANRPIPYKGKIASVDKDAKTFTIQGKEKSRVFKISDSTKLLKAADAAATWDDLKVGEEVRGTAKKTGEGQFEAVKVMIGPKEAGAKAETAKKPEATEKKK